MNRSFYRVFNGSEFPPAHPPVRVSTRRSSPEDKTNKSFGLRGRRLQAHRCLLFSCRKKFRHFLSFRCHSRAALPSSLGAAAAAGRPLYVIYGLGYETRARCSFRTQCARRPRTCRGRRWCKKSGLSSSQCSGASGTLAVKTEYISVTAIMNLQFGSARKKSAALRRCSSRAS